MRQCARGAAGCRLPRCAARRSPGLGGSGAIDAGEAERLPACRTATVSTPSGRRAPGFPPSSRRSQTNDGDVSRAEVPATPKARTRNTACRPHAEPTGPRFLRCSASSGLSQELMFDGLIDEVPAEASAAVSNRVGSFAAFFRQNINEHSHRLF